MPTRKITAWSVVHGMKVTRVSAADARGGEHYALVPHERRGAEHRDRLREAAEAVERRAASGADPGEVQMEDA